MSGQSTVKRRTFFTAIGLAAAAGVAAKFSSTKFVPTPGESIEPVPKGSDYRLTEHIKKYYRTTTI